MLVQTKRHFFGQGELERGEWILSPGMPTDGRNLWVSRQAMVIQTGNDGFKHIGLPRAAANWDFYYDKILGLKQANPNVLNLFAYTGGASL